MESKKQLAKDEVSSQTVERELSGESDSEQGRKVNGLKRQLKRRHVAMISIGGVLGTGLFLGTATSLQRAGPLGLFLGYCVMGTICYSVMVSLGEMIAYLPIPGGHIRLAERFVNPALSFALGWFYMYAWLIPGEMSATVVLTNYWAKGQINNSVWLVIYIGAAIAVNLFGAGAYGEVEFIVASIKVITIVGLIILGIILDLGGGPNHDRIGFRYWKDPGPFSQIAGIPGTKGQFLGWWSVMIQAAFAYIGTETVSIAAGESKNPRHALPKAIRNIYIRILIFYLGGTFVIGLLVPSNDPRLSLTSKTAASSPFVIAIERAGIKTLPSIINAVLLSSAWSAATSGLFNSSRALYGLSLAGNAPKIFRRVSKRGLPYTAVLFCASFKLLAFMTLRSEAGRVFVWFTNLSAISGMITWCGICSMYLRFHAGLKAQGIDRSTLPYSSPLQPYAAWYGVVWCALICLFSGWQVFLHDAWATDAFITRYLPLALFPVTYLTGRILHRQPIIRPSEMDLKTGVDEAHADSYEEEPPRNLWEKFWAWVA